MRAKRIVALSGKLSNFHHIRRFKFEWKEDPIEVSPCGRM
jgi:hypothetical protein